MARPRTWTDDQLRRVASECDRVKDVPPALGLGPWKENYQTVRRHADRLGIELPDGRRRRKVPRPAGSAGR